MNTYIIGLWPLEIFQFFQFGDRLYTSESDVYRRQILTYNKHQILTYKDDPCAERVKQSNSHTKIAIFMVDEFL